MSITIKKIYSNIHSQGNRKRPAISRQDAGPGIHGYSPIKIFFVPKVIDAGTDMELL
jgi:hypothetical protein